MLHSRWMRALLGACLLLLLIAPETGWSAPARGLSSTFGLSAPSLHVLRGDVALPGSVLRNLAGAHRVGKLNSRSDLGIGISLTVRHPRALDRLITQVSTPGSSLYHHYLSVSQFTARFAPTLAERERVTAWLRASGLEIGSWSRNGLLITARGPVASMEQAFRTALYTYHGQGGSFFANAGPVHAPAALASSIGAIIGLNNRDRLTHSALPPQRLAPRRSEARPHDTSFQGYGPSDITHAYDVLPLYQVGTKGAGQTVGIVGGGIASSDIAAFDRQFNLPSGGYDLVAVNDPSARAQLKTDAEFELDLEMVHGIAPDAHVLLYQDANDRLTGIFYTFAQMVSEDRAQVLTTSVDGAEENFPSTLVTAMHDVFREAAVQGQTVFAASGDQAAFGAVDQNGNRSTKLAVHFPCSDLYVTCVGGTSLSPNRDGTYGAESVWADGSDRKHPLGSTGGFSTIFNRLPWQIGPGTDNQYSKINTHRMVPDVSANADPQTGYAVYVTDQGQTGWGVFGGTSASSPLWAGYTALLNQSLGAHIGFFNPTLYVLGQRSASFPTAPFHDITRGNNLYYPATSGYDLATGWGSFDGTGLSADLHLLDGPIRTPIITLLSGDVTHKVHGAAHRTTSLRSGETGTFHVLYSVAYQADQTASGSVAFYEGKKLVGHWTMKGSTAQGHAAFSRSLAVHRRGSYIADFTVTVGQYATSGEIAFKVR